MDAISPISSVTGGMSTNSLLGIAENNNQPEQAEIVGKEFEGVFLSMLLKNMRSTISEDGMFAGDKSDTFGSMFDLFMSQHLANSDSLGVGNLIEEVLFSRQDISNSKDISGAGEGTDPTKEVR